MHARSQGVYVVGNACPLSRWGNRCVSFPRTPEARVGFWDDLNHGMGYVVV